MCQYLIQSITIFGLAGLIPSLSLQQLRMAIQKQKREQDLKDFSPKKTVPTQTDHLKITLYN